MIQVLRVVHATAQALRAYSFLLVVPLLVTLFYEPWNLQLVGPVRVPVNALVYLAAFALTAVVWLPTLGLTGRVAADDLEDMEAFLALGLSLILLPWFAAWPFLWTGSLDSITNAVFDAAAGLTTTAATTLYAAGATVPPSIFAWRATLQAGGGFAILVMAVAFLGRLTQRGLHVLQAPGPHIATTRIQRRALLLMRRFGAIYGVLLGGLILILVGVLRIGGMPWRDATLEGFLLACATISTGGFVAHSTGIAFYDNWILEGILVPFMFIGAMSFPLLWQLINGNGRLLWRDPELRLMLVLLAGVTSVVIALLVLDGASVANAADDALFTVVSMMTTTGFHVVDHDTWPEAAQLLLVLVLFIGGATASTAGGLKGLRVVLMLKILRRELRKLLHPRAVIPVRAAKRVVPEKTLMRVIAFFFAMLTLWIFATGALLVLEPGLGLLDGAAATIAALSNGGTGLGILGPGHGYAHIHDASKWLLATLMLLGRVEILPLLLLLRPDSWRA